MSSKIPQFQTLKTKKIKDLKSEFLTKKVTPTAPTDYAEQLKLRKSAKNGDYQKQNLASTPLPFKPFQTLKTKNIKDLKSEFLIKK